MSRAVYVVRTTGRTAQDWELDPKTKVERISTWPSGEDRARQNLERQGFDVWLPEFIDRRRVYHGRIRERIGPLIPGYLFVTLDLAVDRWRSIYGTLGVACMLGFQPGHPEPVRDGSLEEIRRRALTDGRVELGDEAARAFTEREPLRVIGGGYAGFNALHQRSGKRRARVLVIMFGREVPADIDLANLERMDAAS